MPITRWPASSSSAAVTPPPQPSSTTGPSRRSPSSSISSAAALSASSRESGVVDVGEILAVSGHRPHTKASAPRRVPVLRARGRGGRANGPRGVSPTRPAGASVPAAPCWPPAATLERVPPSASRSVNVNDMRRSRERTDRSSPGDYPVRFAVTTPTTPIVRSTRSVALRRWSSRIPVVDPALDPGVACAPTRPPAPTVTVEDRRRDPLRTRALSRCSGRSTRTGDRARTCDRCGFTNRSASTRAQDDRYPRPTSARGRRAWRSLSRSCS